jgi:hypothetical protein
MTDPLDTQALEVLHIISEGFGDVEESVIRLALEVQEKSGIGLSAEDLSVEAQRIRSRLVARAFVYIMYMDSPALDMPERVKDKLTTLFSFMLSSRRSQFYIDNEAFLFRFFLLIDYLGFEAHQKDAMNAAVHAFSQQLLVKQQESSIVIPGNGTTH